MNAKGGWNWVEIYGRNMKIYNYNIMEIREKCGCYSWDETQPACPAGKVGWKQTG